MVATEELPKPHLDARLIGARRIPVLTDEALFSHAGVRIAFTCRDGGVSEGVYGALNLGGHVGDDACAVAENRRLLLEALGAQGSELVVPNQVHGVDIVDVTCADEDAMAQVRTQVEKGADGIAVATGGVAALLCFADCAPVIVVSPSGRFVVAHAGWRGAVAGIAGAAVRRLAALDACDSQPFAAASYNVYIGPHIHEECFETAPDVADRFAKQFGTAVTPDKRHVTLAAALRVDVQRAGVDSGRIVDAGICTACEPHRFFSYRASGGTCGRHGAIAVRLER